MKVSVIIPVFNEEKYIKSCLDSLISQEEKPDEIIVIDNNSTDRTIDIVKKYPQVKVINEKKQGIAYARNAGFNAATGDILVKCDADSRFPINFIKNIKKKFSDSNSIVGLSM
ncbi:MAG: Glycosyl transferase, partial [Candidatus Roizmanbacteria bacterium GW2011_GWC2_37_13]